MTDAVISRTTELRKLSYYQLHQIASHMNHGRNWQQLMMRIPKDLQGPEQHSTTASDASQSTKFKYTHEHMRMIEEASASGRPPKLPGHILFEEWGTSGKIRPTVAHLLQLLVEANLFRAADFVAIDILNEEPPSRPISGPAAPIDIGSIMDDSLGSMNFDSASITFNGTATSPRSNSSSTGQLPAMTDLFGNEAIVTAEENSNAPTMSTNIESDPVIEGLSDVDIPNLSMLQNAGHIGQSHSHYSDYPTIESDSAGSVYQSNVPNMSLFGGMNFAEQQQFSTATHSSGNNSSSSVSLRSDMSLIMNNSSNNNSMSNHSLPQLSFLMNNVRMEESGDFVSSSTAASCFVQKFDFHFLQSCTNNFNDEDFKDLNSTGRKLGAGGFGIVHLGRDLSRDIPLAAVKRLHRNFDQVKEKFDLERQILSLHRHENLVQLLGYSDDAGEMCLIYEFVGGGNLERRLECCRNGEAHLSVAKRLGVAVGVARGIDYLHTAQLIHRDVKSANVLLTIEDVPKLCDFGLLRQLNSRTTTMTVGSSGYMAPEIVRGTYDYEKVDIFAFGVLQLELLTGLPVISAERREDLVTFVEKMVGNEGDITGLLDRRAGDWTALGQRWFSEVVAKALELSPNRRSDIVECLQRLNDLCNITG